MGKLRPVNEVSSLPDYTRFKGLQHVISGQNVPRFKRLLHVISGQNAPRALRGWLISSHDV
jgi:hypothetical protein